MFAQDEQKLLSIYRRTYDAELETRIEKMYGIYQSLWDKYHGRMSDYWLKSSQLSYRYWHIATCMENRERPGYKLPGFPISWNDPQFSSAMPYVDYLYRPDNYDRFVNVFFEYKLEQLRSDNMTVTGDIRNGYKSNYYIGRFLFTGYPRLLLMKKDLKAMMQQQHYPSYRAEYADFMQTCREPELRREVYTLHRQLMQLEPGRKIQDVNPELAKLPFLKEKADGYIMLNTKNRGYAWDLSWTGTLWKTLRNAGLSGLVKVVALRPEEYTEALPDSLKNPNRFLYTAGNSRMSLSDDFPGLFTGELILLRTDGTIVTREFSSGNDFGNLANIIRADMAVRDHKPEQSHETLRWVLLAILFTGIIAAAIAALRVRLIRRREKNRRKITELELKAIRSQMNPHFMFNALGSIQSLINQGKTDEANHYLVNFARLLRMVLSSSEKKLVPLSEELEQLDLYLRLEQLRVPFMYNISACSNVHPAGEEIPGMLIQPVVENAVIHGIVPRQGGCISIHIRKENNILFVDVTDDGAGIADEALKKNGFGIRAINERLALLNDEMKTGIGLEIENRLAKEGVPGTRVTISIPV
jgi:signal transduction histidine kinase